jgi:hypothetical protein
VWQPLGTIVQRARGIPGQIASAAYGTDGPDREPSHGSDGTGDEVHERSIHHAEAKKKRLPNLDREAVEVAKLVPP